MQSQCQVKLVNDCFILQSNMKTFIQTYNIHHKFVTCCEAAFSVVAWLLAVFLRPPDCYLIIVAIHLKYTCIHNTNVGVKPWSRKIKRYQYWNLLVSERFIDASMYHDTFHAIRIEVQFARIAIQLNNKMKHLLILYFIFTVAFQFFKVISCRTHACIKAEQERVLERSQT